MKIVNITPIDGKQLPLYETMMRSVSLEIYLVGLKTKPLPHHQ